MRAALAGALAVFLCCGDVLAGGEVEAGGGVIFGSSATTSPVGASASARSLLRLEPQLSLGLGFNATSIGFDGATPEYPTYSGRVSTLWAGPVVRGTVLLGGRTLGYGELGFGFSHLSDEHLLRCSAGAGVGPSLLAGMAHRVGRVTFGGAVGWHGGIVLAGGCLARALPENAPESPRTVVGVGAPLAVRATVGIAFGDLGTDDE